jgi:hypothetical protein
MRSKRLNLPQPTFLPVPAVGPWNDHVVEHLFHYDSLANTPARTPVSLHGVRRTTAASGDCAPHDAPHDMRGSAPSEVHGAFPTRRAPLRAPSLGLTAETPGT